MLLRLLVVIVAVFGPAMANKNWYTIKTEEVTEPPPIAFDEPDQLPQAPEDLQYAFIIFRHGIRSPIYTPFQTENEFKEMWPEGMGALTDDGKRLMYHVGESLRLRYNHLVPEFNEDVVHFTSTHSGRSTMSTYCVAAAMFPPKEPIFEGDEDGLTPWQPIPVWQNTPYDKHKLFNEKLQQSHCRRYTEMREHVRGAEKSRTTELRKEFYKNVNTHIFNTYHKYRFADSLQDNSKVYDIYKAQILNQKPVPIWAPKLMSAMEKMKQVRMWSFIHGKPKMIQYFTGTLFHQILSEMDEQSAKLLLKEHEAIPDDGHRVKIHFHGSHDITVCPTVWALSRDEKYLALPGDTVMIEMTARAVKAYLYVPLEKEKDKRFREIPLQPICGKGECTLTEFRKALEDLAFDEAEWKKRCNSEFGQPLVPDFRPYPQDISKEDLSKPVKPVIIT